MTTPNKPPRRQEDVLFARTTLDAAESPARHLPDHLVVLQLGPPVAVAWTEGGRETTRRLGPGAVSVLPAGPAAGFRSGPVELLTVRLAPAFFAAAARPDGGRPPDLRHVKGADDPAVRDLLLALAREDEAGRPTGRLYADALGVTLATYLARHYGSAPAAGLGSAGPLAHRRLRRVLEYVEAHLAEDLSLAALAAVAGLGVDHFARSFRAATGEPPHRFVLRRRVERAKGLLAGGTRPLADLALDLGFASQAHFTDTFRRLAGTTPGRFRAGS